MSTKPTYDEVLAAYDQLVAEKERYRAALSIERERCAKIAEGFSGVNSHLAPRIAAAIRANG